MDFPEKILDVAIMGELIEHYAYPEEILERIFKFVKPGGLVILSKPKGQELKIYYQPLSKPRSPC